MPPRKTKTTKGSPKTKDASWKLTTIPLHSWILFWVLILATMALASVCFTTAFRPAENQADAEALAVFEAVKKNLERQITELEGKVEVSQQPGGRIIIDATSNQLTEDEVFQSKWNIEPATVYVQHIDPTTKLSMTLPYNFSWGTEKYALNPVDAYANFILFGPAYPFEGGLTRGASLSIENSTSSAAIRKEIQTLRNNGEQIEEIRERIINGMTVISFTQGDGSSYTRNLWIGVGRTYLYRIESSGWLTDAEAVKIIQSLRVAK
ncbi:hypothetical protein EDM68_00480 [Candidatus Uhrbacteria bacterium]|nr:MAG: hypothetical protein EDM68_00480 [Candidatus Uhrbacteria bacterium]